MGKRKWKAKKEEKKRRKQQQSEENSATKSERQKSTEVEEYTAELTSSLLRDVEMESDNDSDGDEKLALARQQAAQKTKKKSGGFQSMGLTHNVLKGILKRGYKVPTPIQRKTIPIILEGKDIVAMARTGSGKTASFLVPMFEKLKVRSATGARAMILSPTRELALQTLKFAKELGKFTGLKAAVILGGDRMEDQFAALHDKPDIIIATPGRLLHILVEMEMKLKAIEYIVFDEADRLFEMGFQDQLREVIQRLPDSRQTLLFSATLPKQLVEFARAGLSDPTLIRLDVDNKLSENLKTNYLWCRESDKCALLMYLLKHVIDPKEQTVIFAATKHHVEFLHQLLSELGVVSSYIYSSLDPAARKINAAKFSLGKVKVLLVTDLAARGIDVPLLDNVINFNFPAKPKLFVHRVGRVARAGRTGVAYSLVSPEEMAHLVDLHMFLGRPVRMVPVGGELEEQDGCIGEVPQSLVDDEEADVSLAIKNSVDLTGLQKVCANAYRKYAKSRPAPATESVRRVRKMIAEGISLGTHPLFASIDVDEKGMRLEMLNALKNYKPKTTIFEINSTKKKTGLSVMQGKRAQHDHVIHNKEAKLAQSSTEVMGVQGSNPSRKRKAEAEADAEQIESVFDEVVSSSSNKKKKKKKLDASADTSEEVKDKENFIQYRPSDYASERGLSIGNSTFERAAADAVLDFTNEDSNAGNTKKRKWDRKKKKFVTETSEGTGKKKKIKTESGNWISASYKSNAYEEWRQRSRQAYQDDDDDNDEEDGRRKNKGGSEGGRFSVSGMRKRKWHTKGMESSEQGPGGKQGKQKFHKGKGGQLKSSDQILKNRRQKAKVQNFQKHRQNVRAKRAGKEQGGGGGKGKGKGRR